MCESASEDELFDEDDADESSDFDHYYRMSDIENEIDYLQDFDKTNDPEYFEYECLPIEEVEKIWNTSVEEICKSLSVTPSRAKVRTIFNPLQIRILFSCQDQRPPHIAILSVLTKKSSFDCLPLNNSIYFPPPYTP